MKTSSPWIAVLALCALSNVGFAEEKTKTAIPAAGADGWISLFNGKDLAGWEGLEGYWSVVDGAIQCSETMENSKQTNLILLYSKDNPEKFANFEIRYSFKWVTPGGNSGVQIRGQIDNPEMFHVGGYQADIAPGITGGLYDESRRNKMLAVPPKELQEKATSLAKDGWNAYTVRAEERRIRLTINGVELLDYTEPDETIPLKGVIALQIHGGLKGTIRYRNLRIRELPAPRP